MYKANSITVDDCYEFLSAAKKLAETYPENLHKGLCGSILWHTPCDKDVPVTRIMYALMKENSSEFINGIGPDNEFTEHRLYFLLFILQLSPLDLHNIIYSRK